MLVKIGNKNVYVEGIGEWLNNKRKRNLALTLIAMMNLEYTAATEPSLPVTQKRILSEVQRLQELNGWPVYGESGYQIQKFITQLIEDDHVIRKDNKVIDETKRGRGGPTSPWCTVYIYPLFRF